MIKPDPLDGRVALVTGAGRGIGRAVAVELSGAGAKVALLARSRDQLEETSQLITEQGGHTVVVPADVSDDDQMTAALDRVHNSVGAVDVLVNNAAVVWPLGPSPEIDMTEWATAVDTNLTSARVSPSRSFRRCWSGSGVASSTSRAASWPGRPR
jgi:NAD(P)-dependent dehydrogenase (short-subunit alcohol dehydrogenase family)